jgi:NAD(P)-dependent dehydrogenase (short-subunit alcohol dehydrogenase family)
VTDSLNQPAVLITGAGRGIGLALVRAFCVSGHPVYATCRDPKSATALTQLAMRESGLRVVRLDAGQEADIAQAAEVLVDPVPQIIICNAVQARREVSLADVGTSDWLAAMQVNALSIALFAQQFAPRLRPLAGCCLVAIGSTMGLVETDCGPGKLTYRASKAALHMIVRTLAEELQPDGLRCFAIHPGWVQTDLGGIAAPLSAAVAAQDIVRLLLDIPPRIDGHLVDRFGNCLN